MTQSAAYVIGIDLGTTNCTVAYTALSFQGHPEEISQEPIIQLIQANYAGESLSLPSFIYFPLEEEAAQGTALPFESHQKHPVGIYARDRGVELPARLIASAKSWLCHPSVNRRGQILPMGSDEIKNKMSPLEACAEFLLAIKESWNQKHPDSDFKHQHVLVTVPASFDPSARELVQEATVQAGFPPCILLEEPQAAFYAWLHSHEHDWRKELKVGDRILVVDIGGGTTDFSLIGVEDEKGSLQLKRLAVGAHLLLGGDNIDLGLAYLAKQKLEDQGHAIDHWQLHSLVHQCRQAKEILLGDEPPEQVEVTILGRGSRLIANTRSTFLTRDEVSDFVLNGYFPLVTVTERSPVERRSGLQEVGLPFVQDARVSCQLAKFLSMSGESDTVDPARMIFPTAVLFNGGTLKAASIRHQLMTLLNQWAEDLGQPAVKELPDAAYDYAVSQGAAYYGLARLGKGVRIRSGSSCSYFIGVEEAVPAVPGMNPPLRAFCIVPFGMEEGEERWLDNREFALVLGEVAAFRFFCRNTPTLQDGTEPVVGQIVRNWQKELTELHPIETTLEKDADDGKLVRVRLKSKMTELGVLELWFESLDGRKWKLEFDTRSSTQDQKSI